MPQGFLAGLVERAKSALEAPKPDATRAIHHTSWDQADYDRVAAEIPAVQAEIEELGETIDYVNDFAGDLHSSFFKMAPQVREAGEMRDGRQANRDIIEQILQMPEVNNLRQHSVADTYGTAMAMVSMKDVALDTAQQVHEARAEADAKAAEAAQQAQQTAQDIQGLLDSLASQAGQSPDAQSVLGGELQAKMDQFAQQQQAQQEFTAAGNAAANKVMQQQANTIRSQAKAADEEMSQEGELASSFGVDPGELQRMPVAERIELAKKLKSNRLAQFVKLLGQFKTVQQAESRKRIINAASEVHGITQSNNLERMVAGEFLNFADESLETLMLLRWTEHQLNTYDVRGKENLGQGPIICVVDESGSMGAADVAGGTREAWSKALALAMCDQARHRKRDFYYLGFGSRGQEHLVHFPNGETKLENVIAMTEHFFSGGTHYEGPLRTALEIIERDFDDSDKGRPDIVFISDDEYGHLDETFLEEYRRVKEKASITTYGIAVGCSVGGAMNQLSDNVRAVTELVSDPRNVGDLFRTI